MMVIWDGGQTPVITNCAKQPRLPNFGVKKKIPWRRKPVRCVCQRNRVWPYSDSPCYSLFFEQTKTLAPSTPLTGRRYLKEKDPSTTPVSTATQSVSKLQSLLVGRKALPSDDLIDILR